MEPEKIGSACSMRRQTIGREFENMQCGAREDRV